LPVSPPGLFPLWASRACVLPATLKEITLDINENKQTYYLLKNILSLLISIVTSFLIRYRFSLLGVSVCFFSFTQAEE